jgi:hypothetical protein
MLARHTSRGTTVKTRAIKAILADSALKKKLDALMRPLTLAYQDAGENYRLEAGSDGRTAGLDIYTFAWHQIRQSGGVKVTAREPYWFELGQDAVACHRVSEKRSDIGMSFPRERSDWPTTVVRQGEFDYGAATGVSNNVLVLAHMGNPVEGLLEVHLCRPLVDEHGSLIQWVDSGLLWSAPQQQGRDLPAVPPEPSKPPATVTISPKRKDAAPPPPPEQPKEPAKIILLKKDQDEDAGE